MSVGLRPYQTSDCILNVSKCNLVPLYQTMFVVGLGFADAEDGSGGYHFSGEMECRRMLLLGKNLDPQGMSELPVFLARWGLQQASVSFPGCTKYASGG